MKLLKITSVLMSAAVCMSFVITPVTAVADETEVPEQTTEAAEETKATKSTKASEAQETKDTEPSEPAETSETTPAEPEPSATGTAEETVPETSKETEPAQETVPSESETSESCSEETEETLPVESGTKEQEASRRRSDAVHTGNLTDNVSYSFNDQDGTLTISGTGGTYSYQKNGSPFQAYKDQVKKVIISDGVTFIGAYMFYDFKNITNVSIADSVTGFDKGAFEGCTGITELKLPANLENVYRDVFKGCTGIKSIKIPGAGNTRLLPGSFSGCTGLISVTIKEGVTKIDEAFKDCTNLKTVDIPKSVKYLADTFDGCTSLTTINYAGTEEEWKKINDGEGGGSFPGVTVVFERAMHTITVLPVKNGTITLSKYEGYLNDEIKITAVPDKGYYYAGYRFNGAGNTYRGTTIYMLNKDITLEFCFSEITEQQIGTSFAQLPFWYEITNNATDGTGTVKCTCLAYALIPDEATAYQLFGNTVMPSTVTEDGVTYKVTSIAPDAFRGVKYFKSFTIGAYVTVIGNNAFYGCANLTKVSGGARLKTIGSNAFSRCPKLSSFKISSKVLSKIGTYAFAKDSKLKTVYIKSTTKLTKKGVKKSLKSSKVKTVKVKKSKVKKYKKYFTKKNCGRKVKVKK